MKDIKSKPKNVRSNTHRLKTSDVVKSKQIVPMSAVDSLKRQYVKSKSEFQKQTAEQAERPENYAVDEVEDKAESTAYAAADTVRQSARYVKNKIQHRSRGQTYGIPVSDSPTQEPVQPQRLNAPKTVALQTGNKPVPQEQAKIKARQEAAVKSAKIKTKDTVLANKTKHTTDNTPKTKAAHEQIKAKHHEVIKNKDTILLSEVPKSSPEPALRIKSKEEYMKNKSAAGRRNYRLKSDKIYKSKAQMIKPKTLQAVRAKQEKQTLKTADNKNQATRKYVQNKLKTKSEMQNKYSQPVSENPIQADAHMPKQKLTPQENIKVKKTDIKTKDSHICTHARNVADIKAKSYGTEVNPHIISQDKRSIKYKPKNTIKSVQNKSFTIKPARKMRMPKTAQHTVKKSANRATVKTQKQVTKQAAKQAAKRSKELARRSVQAAKTAGAEDNTAEDVVVFDDAKAEKLKEYFRTANTVEYTVEETQVSETETAKKLIITISGKTKEELMDEYSLTVKQREAVETLLEHGDVLTASSRSLAITNADVQSIINGLPASLPQKRKDVVKNAGSLVGKVNYFWGGKSAAIGWDSAWGSMQRVTAAGSPSSGTIRAYGLDCSGFVSWAFNNSGMYVGDGTYGQRDRSIVVSSATVQAGDLAFLPSYSHVGIVVGQDAGGNILVIHCPSSANNVVVSTASLVGFTVFRRPNCY